MALALWLAPDASAAAEWRADVVEAPGTLGEHILDVAVAQSEAEIEPDSLLDDDARKAVATV